MKYTLSLGVWLFIAVNALALDFSHSLKISRQDAGKPLPAFSLPALDGGRIDSESLSGKVLLLNFWATWCGPCKEEMPSLESLRTQFPPDQLQILAVTTDIRPQDIKAFWNQLGLHFPVLLDEQEELTQALIVRNLPTTILVDTRGKIEGRVMGPREWDNQDAIAFVRSLISHP
jgi:thiol-disulfide isomerase/thioredoxin